MPVSALSAVVATVTRSAATPPATDGELLRQFVRTRDESAFGELVRRLGPAVLGVCRRFCGDAHLADDAFQAAFVVLVRKAHALTDRACVGNFLYGVAFHTALKAKAMAAKRRAREARSAPPEGSEDRAEVLAALDAELAQLPAKYREPVVRCELEGHPRRAVAEALGVAEGTLSSRLATAHRMLAQRLRARGFGAVAVAALLAESGRAVAEPLARAALGSATGGAPPAVSQLASEVLKMTLLHRLGIGGAALAVAVALVSAGLVLALPANPVPPVPAPVFIARAADPEPAWKAEFRKAYGLARDEVVRRVAPPFPACRNEYFRDEVREVYKRAKLEVPAGALDKDYTDSFLKFGWKGDWPDANLTERTVPAKPDEGMTLMRVLESTTGMTLTRIEGERLSDKVTGDWVVRAGATPEQVVAALEPILDKQCEFKVVLRVKEVERAVYVLSGKYAAKPLEGRKDHEIEFYATELQDRKAGGGGGTGTFARMAESAEGWIGFPVVVDKVEGAPARVSWHYNFRSPFTEEQHAADKNAEAVMKNLSAQTGLSATLEKRTIKVLVASTKR